MPEKGFPADGKVEEGRYLDNRKNGTWVYYHADGITPRVIGTFLNGRPNGYYTKYSQADGKILETGCFLNGKQVGIFRSYYQSGCVQVEKNFDSLGRERDTPRYFLNDCDVDSTVYGSAKFLPQVTKTTACTWYGYREKTNWNDTIICEIGITGFVKDGKKFNPDGYNNVYNQNDELWIDGTFKSAKLWEGKLYKYDRDGILLKIEIWKDGCYHSDGDL